MTAQILSEQQRRLHNIATIGTVFDVNPDDQTMRLDVGDNQTDWLPIPALAAGQVRVWRCPSVGEQFLLVSPSFLSRLCGGEAKAQVDQAREAFLSRLCGGEVR